MNAEQVIGAYFDWEEKQTGVITNCEAFQAGAAYAATLRQAARVDEATVERAFQAMDAVFAAKCPDRTPLESDDKALACEGLRAALEAALSAQPAEPAAQAEAGYPKVNGVSRDGEFSRALCVFFDRRPTDDELRNFHDAISSQPRASEPAQAESDPALKFEEALAELIEAVDPTIDSGDILADARAAAMFALRLREQPAGRQGEVVAWTTVDESGRGPWIEGYPSPEVFKEAEDIGQEVVYRCPTPTAAPVGVPDGWVLVPREPTPEMLSAVEGSTCSVRIAEDDSAEYPLSEDECAEIYRNMLAAAPSAPQGVE